mmetsp:Transcript_21158/g.15481  ORF Transcript_21158/g.15481 Transcript_21158/m.15481 type:complete len:130 (-) Transcript_21158:313-702(-)
MLKLLKGDSREFRHFELDSRVGLNGQKCFWMFPCLLNEQEERFFVWMGEVPISKFTKSTFMNIVAFAEQHQAKEVVLILNKEHPQKSQFKTLFKVVDAGRVSSKKLAKYVNGPKALEAAEKCEFYSVSL